MTTAEITYAVLSFSGRKSSTTIQDIQTEFPHVEHAVLTEVVGEMAEARLLRATAQRSVLIDGPLWIISDIRGLTILGQQWLDGFSPMEDDTGFIH